MQCKAGLECGPDIANCRYLAPTCMSSCARSSPGTTAQCFVRLKAHIYIYIVFSSHQLVGAVLYTMPHPSWPASKGCSSLRVHVMASIVFVTLSRVTCLRCGLQARQPQPLRRVGDAGPQLGHHRTSVHLHGQFRNPRRSRCHASDGRHIPAFSLHV